MTRHLPFSVNRMEVATPTDLAAMHGPQLQAFVAANGKEPVINRVTDVLSRLPIVPFDRWPEPRGQTGATCQTVAIVNGVRALQALNPSTQLWDPSEREVAALQQDSILFSTTSEGGSTPYAANAVAAMLTEQGVLRSYISAAYNPVHAIETMAEHGGGFAVFSDGTSWRTVIPNLPRIGQEAFLYLDSTTGTQTPMSATQFVDSFLHTNWAPDAHNNSEIVICQLPVQEPR